MTNVPKFVDESMKYLVYQKEGSPSTGKPHWQGYVEYKITVGLKTLQKDFDGAHVEVRKGPRHAAREYCMKDESRLEPAKEFGIWSDGQGDRTDIKAAAALAKAGKWKDIDASTYIKFHRGLREYARVHSQVPLRRDVKVYVWWGPTGCGKSHDAFAGAENDPKACAIDWHGGWADPYDDQKTVVFDEFDGDTLPVNIFLKLLDKYRTTVNCKGVTAKPWLVEKIFISSRKHPGDWYPGRRSEVLRRITTITHKPDPYVAPLGGDKKTVKTPSPPDIRPDNVAMPDDSWLDEFV